MMSGVKAHRKFPYSCLTRVHTSSPLPTTLPSRTVAWAETTPSRKWTPPSRRVRSSCSGGHPFADGVGVVYIIAQKSNVSLYQQFIEPLYRSTGYTILHSHSFTHDPPSTLFCMPRRLAHANAGAARKRTLGALDGTPASTGTTSAAAASLLRGQQPPVSAKRTWVGWMWGAPAPASGSGSGSGSAATAAAGGEAKTGVSQDGEPQGEQIATGLDRDEWRELEMLVSQQVRNV